jgi:hypothetical protein
MELVIAGEARSQVVDIEWNSLSFVVGSWGNTG